MDIQNKIEELKSHVVKLEDEIKSKREEINQTRLTVRRLIKHMQKADDILNGVKISTTE